MFYKLNTITLLLCVQCKFNLCLDIRYNIKVCLYIIILYIETLDPLIDSNCPIINDTKSIIECFQPKGQITVYEKKLYYQ